MSDRLRKTDWLNQGLRSLGEEGPQALKVGRLAAALGVSRGSFYWHFRDLAEFRAQLLQRWRDRETETVIHQLETEKVGPLRLGQLMQWAFSADGRLDRAIRGWAVTDATVAEAVAAVDARRVDYLTALLVADGVAPETAGPRAIFLYWAYLGQALDMAPGHAPLPPKAMDALSALLKDG